MPLPWAVSMLCHVLEAACVIKSVIWDNISSSPFWWQALVAMLVSACREEQDAAAWRNKEVHTREAMVQIIGFMILLTYAVVVH